MNQLTILTQGNQQVVDSREVAEMVGKTHAHLLRDIAGYIDVLEGGKSDFGFTDFFIESSYQDNTGREATLKQIHAIIEYLEDDKLIIVYRNIQRILLHEA